MFRILLLSILFFSSIVYALDDTALLKRANSFINSSNKSNQFRAYNDFKNLYLRAMMHEDTTMQYAALKGIVTSGDKLHIDVSRYKKELASFKKKSVRSKKNAFQQKKHTKKVAHKKFQLTQSHLLKYIGWKEGELVLSFNKKLSYKQINYFNLYDRKHKIYKYVFDIHAMMNQRSKRVRHNGFVRINLAQYKAETIRLVLQSRTQVPLHFRIDGKKLIIYKGKRKATHKAKVKKTTKTPLKHPFLSKTIVIDAGHGGKDPGAVGYRKYREKVVVLSIAKELKKILKRRGYRVYMTREGDYFIKLRNRTKYANKKRADLFISIHANAISGKRAKEVEGIECYFLDKSRSRRAKRVAAQENSADLSEMDFYGKESFLSTLNSHNIVASNKLAIDLQRGALATLRKYYSGVKDAGVRPAPFWVLVGAQMPAVLVEVGFITNPKEAQRLANKTYQKRVAQGLSNGIERYFINN